jgi:hypothetical protein
VVLACGAVLCGAAASFSPGLVAVAVVALSFNLSFTVRRGTTRVRRRTMAKFTSARPGTQSPVA